MIEHKIQISLRQVFEIPLVRKDIPNIVVVIFYMRLLAWCLWVAIKDICPYLSALWILFKEGDFFKLCPTVSEDQGKEAEIVDAEKLLKEI